MLANFEHRENIGKNRVWAGRYENLHNLPHWHLECELLFVEKGSVTLSLNNTLYDLETGCAFFIDSGEVHYIKGESESIAEILMFDSPLLDEITKSLRPLSPKLSSSYPVRNYYNRIKRELSLREPFFEQKICGYISDLMIEIFRKELLGERKQNNTNSSTENYKNLLQEIEEKCSYITFEDACRFMGLSKPYFSRFFKNISGMTFSQYLNIIRLEKAIFLLNHNHGQLSITDIASQCGFDTIRHFNRVFKDFTGFSPRQLPSNFVLSSHSIKSMQQNFNPTLPSSRLLD